MMRFFCFLILICFSNLVEAQDSLTAKRYFIGVAMRGFTDVSREKNDQGYTVPGSFSKSTDFYIRPIIGRVFNDRTYFGIAPYFSKSSRFYISSGLIGPSTVESRPSSRSSYGIGTNLFLRYHLNSNNRIRIFLQPELGLGYYKRTNSIIFPDDFVDTSESSDSFFSLKTVFGASSQINKNFRAIINVGSMGYYLDRSKFGSISNYVISNTFRTDFSTTSVAFGFEYLLSRK
jgi:hypothetical protein